MSDRLEGRMEGDPASSRMSSRHAPRNCPLHRPDRGDDAFHSRTRSGRPRLRTLASACSAKLMAAAPCASIRARAKCWVISDMGSEPTRAAEVAMRRAGRRTALVSPHRPSGRTGFCHGTCRRRIAARGLTAERRAGLSSSSAPDPVPKNCSRELRHGQSAASDPRDRRAFLRPAEGASMPGARRSSPTARWRAPPPWSRGAGSWCISPAPASPTSRAARR